MNKTMNSGMPTANLAINKSRMKVYTKKSELPTYYLQKGQEFQIELFNPTTDTILAKISLNGNKIGQGGLVLRPGERVFLDRYIDVAKKFKFDTYEVSNSSEVKEAIKNNGDFKVEFFNEYIAPPVITPPTSPWEMKWELLNDSGTHFTDNNTININNQVYGATTNFVDANTSNLTGSLGVVDNNNSDVEQFKATFDSLDFAPQELSRKAAPEIKILPPEKSVKGGPRKKSRRDLLSRTRSKKSIETGRVEQGSTSNQTMDIVYKNWLLIPFHTLEYKMLPISQKVNTIQDIQSKRYCTNCGSKTKQSWKFCPSCSNKV